MVATLQSNKSPKPINLSSTTPPSQSGRQGISKLWLKKVFTVIKTSFKGLNGLNIPLFGANTSLNNLNTPLFGANTTLNALNTPLFGANTTVNALTYTMNGAERGN